MSKYVLNPPTTQNTDPRFVKEALGEADIEIKGNIPKWAIALGLGFAWMKFTTSGKKAAKKIGL